ncbi:glycosyltransferase [Cytobacillus sp. FSL R5-0596]|uniref:glycosyltransferase n=1 Tax=Cytobacillus sp. FSL R5-0596 TaxID=2954696 RepID=UPI0030F9EAE1
MKNIAILITKLNGGGAERAAANLSIGLSNFYNVKIITFDGENQTYSHGGELIDLMLPPTKGKFNKIINVFKRVKAVKEIKKKYDIECSISLMDGPNLVNVLSKYKDKVVISIRIFMSISRRNKLFIEKLKTNFVLKKTNKVVAVAKAIEVDLITNFGADSNKLLTINNYCDFQKIKEQAAVKEIDEFEGFEEGYKYVVTAGRLTKQKGQWHLIRSFSKVLESIPNTKLVIIGKGKYLEKLIQLSKDLGIQDKVIFTGYVNNPHKIISKCDVFAFPSLFEGFSNALLEAMACNIAVVSSDCDSGSREILAPETPFDKKTDKMEIAKYGIITPVCNGSNFNAIDQLTKQEEILCNALTEMLVNDALREEYANNSRERILNFSPEIITNQWRGLIEQITSK